MERSDDVPQTLRTRGIGGRGDKRCEGKQNVEFEHYQTKRYLVPRIKGCPEYYAQQHERIGENRVVNGAL